MNKDRPIIGVLLMLGFCILAPMADAVAKLLSGAAPIGFVLLVRFAVQVIVLTPIAWASGQSWPTEARFLRIIALRTVLHMAAIACMFAALWVLPLADAVAIGFVMPFILLLMGYMFLQEEVGQNRLLACLVGFLGTLLIVQPSFASVGWPALLPIAMAILFSIFMLLTRTIAKETDPISLQAVSGIMAIVLLAPALWIGTSVGYEPLSLVAVSSYGWTLMLGIGALGTAAHLLMTWSLRYAPTATLAPMQYLEIPFATALGLLVFGDLPNGLAILGMALTVAAGLYIIYREGANAQNQAAAAVPEPAE